MAQADTPPSSAASSQAAIAPEALPDGVVMETSPLKVSMLERVNGTPALFRPSANMPDIVSEDFLRGRTASGQVPAKLPKSIGYLPRLKVLPCTNGCEGKDYDRAVKAFISGFRGDGQIFQERGEMVVQVRWFNARNFLTRQVPYSADVFGVSFILEGKLVSLGMSSGVGKDSKADDLAEMLGGRLALELAVTLGTGERPSFLTPMPKTQTFGFAKNLIEGMAAVNGVMGDQHVHPRIEPATEAHKHLLPGIDGIAPGEVRPITEMHYVNSVYFF